MWLQCIQWLYNWQHTMLLVDTDVGPILTATILKFVTPPFSRAQTVQQGTSLDIWIYNPCHLGGSLTLQSGGQNQKWPISGQIGYVTPAVWEVPNASKRGTKSEVAHKWANWLHKPCRLGGPQRFKAGDKIRSGP